MEEIPLRVSKGPDRLRRKHRWIEPIVPRTISKVAERSGSKAFDVVRRGIRSVRAVIVKVSIAPQRVKVTQLHQGYRKSSLYRCNSRENPAAQKFTHRDMAPHPCGQGNFIRVVGRQPLPRVKVRVAIAQVLITLNKINSATIKPRAFQVRRVLQRVRIGIRNIESQPMCARLLYLHL